MKKEETYEEILKKLNGFGIIKDPINLIDAILFIMYNNEGLFDLVGWQKLITWEHMDFDKLRAILEKLHKDGYAIKPSENLYQISFEGKLFYEEGGYNQLDIDKKINRESIRLKNEKERINQILLVRGAIGAAIGAIGLVIWEMIKYIFLETHTK